MNIFDTLVLPQSAEHTVLLHFLGILLQMIFLPFFSLLIAGTLLSVYYKRKARKTGQEIYLRFSSEIIEIAAVNKSIGIIMGIVPVLALVIIYAQILHTIQVSTVTYLIISVVFLTCGVVAAYSYRYAFKYSNLFSKIKHEGVSGKITGTIAQAESNVNKLNSQAGGWSVWFLLIGSYFMVGGLYMAGHTAFWNGNASMLDLFASSGIFFKWVQMITFAITLSASVLLFVFFYWEGGRIKNENEEYKSFVKNKLFRIMFLFGLFQPLLIVAVYTTFPAVALSQSIFFFAAVMMVSIFAAFHLLYDMYKNNNLKHVAALMSVLLFFLFSGSIAEQLSVRNSTVKNAALLAVTFEESVKELEKKTASAAGLTGEEIFVQKCSACHKYDVKVVGPPYKETLPKYEGNVSKLIEFIKNPVKIDAAYPPMPNQGLKPAEVKAIAKYIMEEYKKY